ncbi:hypothetical protein [Spirosoma radiotolerans]|uniref:hypothetical protein n=1 Tax=Spirosoma radiotolerans TaxID=1379870 RepID=UPI000B0D083B|nr:hypothetical protein [Spirosoma radiotolerans]
MQCFFEEAGFRTIPISPRSPLASTFSYMDGVGSNAPFLMTRKAPLLSYKDASVRRK